MSVRYPSLQYPSNVCLSNVRAMLQINCVSMTCKSRPLYRFIGQHISIFEAENKQLNNSPSDEALRLGKYGSNSSAIERLSNKLIFCKYED